MFLRYGSKPLAILIFILKIGGGKTLKMHFATRSIRTIYGRRSKSKI
jgi:hypothetical protein